MERNGPISYGCRLCTFWSFLRLLCHPRLVRQITSRCCGRTRVAAIQSRSRKISGASRCPPQIVIHYPAMDIRPFKHGDEEAVIDLWVRCDLARPQNDSQNDIARKLVVQPQSFLLAVDKLVIVGTVMFGYEGHRGWINYLAVDPDHRLQGIGRELMCAAERALRAVGCPKINLQVRSTNEAVIAFYHALGFQVDEVVSMGKRLQHD